MENNSNIRKVEKAMKEALKNDRARIQVGRISSFGLFEMSRQRLRTGVLEASTRQCPHCEGTGLVRTASSAGLSALRMLEDEAARGRGSRLMLRASQEAALYVLNRKRAELAEIEDRYGVMIEILSDGTLEGARMSVEAGGPPPSHAPRLPAPVLIEADDDLVEDEVEEDLEIEAEAEDAEDREEGERGEGRSRRRRRRRRRGGRGREQEGRADSEEGEESAEAADGAADGAERTDEAVDEGDGEARRGRRRGRRSGRRRGGEGAAVDGAPAEQVEQIMAEELPAEAPVADAPEVVAEESAPKARRRPRARKSEQAVAPVEEVVTAPVGEASAAPVEAPAEEPKPRRGGRRKKVAELVEAEAAEAAPEPETAVVEEPAAPKRRSRARAKAAPGEIAEVMAAPAEADSSGMVVTEDSKAGEDAEESYEGPPRRGWWQRTFGA